jgi:signal transduction histidine kinase/CheY-like chemotaxis protein
VKLKQPDGSAYPPEQFPLERAIRDGERVWAEEIHVELPDGTVVPMLVNAVPIHSLDDKIAGGILALQDISAFEEVNRLHTEFLGMVSHELKNPLSNIKGAAYVGLKSRMPLDSAEVVEMFEMIHEEAQRMQSIMDDLLDINRIEAGLIPLAPEPESLEEILQEAREVFSRSRRSHHLVINISEDLPLVRVDRHRVLQVLENLLDNASKYSPPSSLISIEVEAESAYVTVQVKDRGWGIPPDKLPLLFNKFVRLDPERGNTAVPSIGLGLAISRGIVEAHGGRIWASSPGEGQGTTFSFTLPVYMGQSVVDDDNKVQDVDADSPGEGATILVVDDEQHAILIVKRLLSEAGYRPVTTTNPFEIAKLIKSESPDLVLLDIRFPQASGFELFRAIRQCSTAPIIFLTASDQEDDTKQASALGAADYITKPYSATELLARIETALRQERGRR